MKWTYGVLCALGFALPSYFFLLFLRESGPDLPLFISQLFANRVSSFFGADVIVSSLVLWVFIYQETRSVPVKLWWLALLANVAVGVSLGLPLFLLLREIGREKLASAHIH